MEQRLENSIQLSILLVFFLAFNIADSHGEDFGQHLPDTLENELDFADSESNEDDEAFLDAYSGQYLEGAGADQDDDDNDEQIDSFAVESPSGKYENIRAKQTKSFETAAQKVAGSDDNTDGLKIKTKKQFLKQYDGKSKGSFGFSFIQDNFSYRDANGVFEKTFRRKNSGDNSSDPYGILRLHGAQYFNEGWLKLGWGGALGVGYNGGKGVFKTTGNISTADLKLWTIPIEAFLDLSLDITSYVQLNLQVAGSALGLIQNRSDFEDGKAKKRRRQMGFGYGLTGFLKLNLSRILPRLGFELLSSNSVNRYYLHLMIRNQSYGNFKSEDLKISGTSYGLGFSIDYL